MLKKILLASIFVITAITNVTHAEDDMKTVASKAYVDTKIETKQLKIPAAGQPNVGAGETVMTYTATGNGQIGERGLYSDISSYDASTDGDKLITASALNATFTNLPTTDTTKLECANQADGCTLWTIVDQTAYGDMLPSGYTRLEYIESTGRQYIDTGISGPVRWVGSAQASSNTTKSQVVLMGNFSGLKGTFVASVADQNKWTTWATDDTDYPITSAQVFDLTWTNTGVSGAIGEVRNINHDYLSGQGLSGTWKICSSNSMYPFAGKLYYFKAYQNDIIVRDFIPARRNSDDVIGMYDTVSGQFFTNSGTGNFAGPPAN